MSQPVVESLTRYDGYHMFYLIYGTNNHYQIHREPLKFKFDRKNKILTGPFNSFAEKIEHSSSDQITFAIWREVIKTDSYEEMDFDTAEKVLRSDSLTIHPSIIELFTYNIHDSYVCADMPTAMILGNRLRDNTVFVYMKRDDNKNITDIAHITFQIKLN